MKNNIKTIRKAAGLTQAALAEKVKVGVPQVSRWEAGSVDIPASRLGAIAEALGCTMIDLVDDRYGEAPPAANAVPFKMEGASIERMRDDLPIYGTALGSVREIDGEAIEQTTLNTADVVVYAKRPVMLNGNAAAYGLYVAGSSMEPRYFDGEMLLADPKGRVRVGEDVIVYLRPKNAEHDDGQTARAVLVKRLIRRTAVYVELQQYSPDKVFRIEMEEIVRVDRVIPWSELIG
jgi:transcriptional regulator with XRE-family HTH domain